MWNLTQKSSWRSNTLDISLPVTLTPAPTLPAPRTSGPLAWPQSHSVPAAGAGPHPSSAPCLRAAGEGPCPTASPHGTMTALTLKSSTWKWEIQKLQPHPPLFLKKKIIKKYQLHSFLCISTRHDISQKINTISSGGEPAQLLEKALMIWTTQTQTRNQMLGFLDLVLLPSISNLIPCH